MVKPRLFAGNISGFNTLLSGAYIGIDVGKSGDSRSDFVGLEVPPILTEGLPGKRFVLPNSKVMIHQGSGGFRGAPSDIQIAAREILAQTRRYAEIIDEHAGRDVEEVVRDIDRDNFMGPDEAVAYGLADTVLSTREAVPHS